MVIWVSAVPRLDELWGGDRTTEIAARSGVPYHTLKALVRDGARSAHPETVRRLARALGVSEEDVRLALLATWLGRRGLVAGRPVSA